MRTKWLAVFGIFFGSGGGSGLNRTKRADRTYGREALVIAGCFLGGERRGGRVADAAGSETRASRALGHAGNGRMVSRCGAMGLFRGAQSGGGTRLL